MRKEDLRSEAGNVLGKHGGRVQQFYMEWHSELSKVALTSVVSEFWFYCHMGTVLFCKDIVIRVVGDVSEQGSY